MQSRSVIYILVASLLAVVLLVAATLTWFATQNPKQLVINAYGSSPYAAMFLPRQSPLVLSLLVNPDQLEQFQESVTHDRQRTQLEWIRLRQGLVAGFDLDYDQDIQPWLGDELTVAMTAIDLDRDPSNGQQPGYLVVAATHDAPRTQEMLELFWQNQAVAGATLAFEQYKGVQIVSAQPSPSPVAEVASQPTLQVPARRLSPLRPTVTNLATAMVGDQFLLVANHPKVLREAINAAQARDVGLLESPTYQQALQHLTSDRVGLAIVNIANIAAWAGLNSVAPRTAIVSIGLEKQGLHLE
ncbi:MAG: DUF3352 domain-containing protein, partial [Cyanobacteriota bacterium SKYGB_h_bin112]|nr:DUF3352 domain-containing protein [Cyanobacteriota bacterium SKYGB_h_bin112]